MAFTTFKRRDAQRFRKLYPRIRKTPRYFTQSDEQMTVESQTVEVDNSSGYTYRFLTRYDTIPTVALSAQLGTTMEGMVNVFITSLDVNGFTCEFSAPFTGKLHIQVFLIGDS